MVRNRFPGWWDNSYGPLAVGAAAGHPNKKMPEPADPRPRVTGQAAPREMRVQVSEF